MMNSKIANPTHHRPGKSVADAPLRICMLTEDWQTRMSGRGFFASVSSATIRSTSADGISSINIEFELNRNIDEATNDVRDKVSRATRRLPVEAEKPVVTKADSDSSPVIYISVEAESMPIMELTDFAERYVVDRFAVLPGVASVNVYGSGSKSMRIWIDRHQLAARELTVADVVTALRRENLELPAGRLESSEDDTDRQMDGQRALELLGDLDDRLPSRLQRGLYDGIVEAMTNANHHAYEQIRDDGLRHEDLQKEWWMFSQVRENRLSVSFCDLGIGIPRSLPLKRKTLWAQLLLSNPGRSGSGHP